MALLDAAERMPWATRKPVGIQDPLRLPQFMFGLVLKSKARQPLCGGWRKYILEIK